MVFDEPDGIEPQFLRMAGIADCFGVHVGVRGSFVVDGADLDGEAHLASHRIPPGLIGFGGC